MTYLCSLIYIQILVHIVILFKCNDLLLINSSKQYINNISRTALRVTSRAFYRFIWVKPVSYHHIHRTLKLFTATPVKIKVRLRHCARNILGYYYLVECIWYYSLKIIYNLFSNKQSQNVFHVLILIENPLYLPKNKSDKLKDCFVKRQITFGWNLLAVFRTCITCGKTWSTILNKHKKWHWCLYILYLFDFINKNRMFCVLLWYRNWYQELWIFSGIGTEY